VLRGVSSPAPPDAYVLRATAQVFGHNAPQIATVRQTPVPITTSGPTGYETTTTYDEWKAADDEYADVMFLDGEFPTIAKGDYAVVSSASPTDGESSDARIRRVDGASVQSRQAYGLSGKTTRLALSAVWWDPGPAARSEITPIRSTVAYVRSEPIRLVGELIEDDVSGSFIDIDGVVDGLGAGR
jgi:hypothetical protein